MGDELPVQAMMRFASSWIDMSSEPPTLKTSPMPRLSSSNFTSASTTSVRGKTPSLGAVAEHSQRL